MEERRRNKRIDLEAELTVKHLDSAKERIVVIDITDASKSGVGFTCKDLLDIGAVYECALTIWTKETIHCFLRIVRIELDEMALYHYGAVFIGMPEQDVQRIAVYEQFSEADQGES
ncbi:MAG: PilZ domain-containing protein [bacterium]|nr:PilZ domain-containing protein [bacterium]MCM1376708.1 PilZ domain-containing protein [Muribaculum sp.]